MLERSSSKSNFEAEALVHVHALYATGVRLTRNPRDAEDLVQDTLLTAYRFFHRYESGTNCKAWLFKILTNTFVNKYRRKTRETEVKQALNHEALPSLMSEDVARASQDPEALHFGPLLSDDVRRALEALPEEYRLAVVLSDIEEFSYKEIADIMECPVGTVMSRLHRGRRTLQKELHEYALAAGIVRSADVIPFPVREAREAEKKS